jgi:hypothetical protein
MRATRLFPLLCLALVTGCGGTPSPPVPAPGGPPATAAAAGNGTAEPQCPAESVILSTLGITVTKVKDPTRSGTTSVLCSYDGERDGGKPAVVMVRLQIRVSAADMAEYRRKSVAQGLAVTDRSGIGDEAFVYVLGAVPDPLNSLVTRKGDRLVYIASAVSYDQEIVLANQLFAG